MHNSAIYQLTVFGGAGAAGVLIAFLFDLFRLKRRIVKTKPLLTHIEDILYWISAATIMFLSSYILTSGETRAYFYMGALIGGLFYMGVLSKPVLWVLLTVIRIVIWPFNEILKFLKPIFFRIMIFVRRRLGKIKNRIAMEGYRTRVGYSRLRNTFIKK